MPVPRCLRWCEAIFLILLSAWIFSNSLSAAVPGGIGWLPRAGTTVAGYVGSDGGLILFEGGIGGWKKYSVPFPHSLTPGNPVTLLNHSGAVFPSVLTVLSSGKAVGTLNLFVDGGFPVDVCPGLNFSSGTHLKAVRHSGDDVVAAVNSLGNLWEINLTHSSRNMINIPVPMPPGQFPPGAPVALVSTGTQLHAFVVDRAGSLLEFVRTGPAWKHKPNYLGGGFLPGSSVSASLLTVKPPMKLQVAAVDGIGVLQNWKLTDGVWSGEPVCSGMLPGSSVECGLSAAGPIVSCVTPLGSWQVWVQTGPAVWSETVIGPGFLATAPLAYSPVAGTFFTVDAAGRLICATWDGTVWRVEYALPDLDWTPQLISRRIVPNESLEPVEISLLNNGTDPLLVQVVDEFRPRPPQEIRIPAGEQAVITLERDAGGSLEEVFLAPGPAGTLIERTELLPLPAQQRYSLVAWSDKVTYQYIDRRKNKPKGAPADFDRRSKVSMGVIPVPPGDLLEPGDTLDIVQLTKELNNPGAVRWFPQPSASQ